MLFNEQLTDLLLAPEGMEGVAVLPESLAAVPAYVISRCNKLFGLSFPPMGSTGNRTFTAQDGLLYTADKTTLLAAPAGLGASVAIAPECTAIAEGAFWGNEKLKTIIATGNVAEISVASTNDEMANGNSALGAAFEQATIENATVITDDREAWEAAGFTNFAKPAEPGDTIAPAPGDSGLTYTLMDNGQLSVKWTGDAPASGKRNIPAAATLHGVDYTVSVIEDGAFEGQTELTEIVLPDTITTIGESAFEGCTSLATIELRGVNTLSRRAFVGCTALAKIDLPGSLHTIGDYSFSGSALESIVIPASVEAIGDYAFSDCEQLATVVSKGSVLDIASTALMGTQGVAIYTPYAADQAYAWTVGAPAAGNHLLPYGVEAAHNLYELVAGQTANLFTDGGYAYAPDGLELILSYKAKVASISDEGEVTAKQPGVTTVNAAILFGDEVLDGTTCTIRVMHAAPEPSSTEEDETSGLEDAAEEGDSLVTAPDDNEGIAARPPIHNEIASLDIPVEETAELRPQITEGSYMVDENAATADKEEASDLEDAPEIADEEVQLFFPGEDATGDADPSDGATEEDRVEGTEQISGDPVISDAPALASSALMCQAVHASAMEIRANAAAAPAPVSDDFADQEDAVYAAERATYTNDHTTYINANHGNFVAHWSGFDPDTKDWFNASYTSGSLAGSPLPTRWNYAADITTRTLAHHSSNAGLKCGVGLDPSYGYFHTSRFDNTEWMNRLSISDAYKTTHGAYYLNIRVTRQGYSFNGWHQGSATGAVFSGQTSLADGKTLYAGWTANKYTITFDRDGGTGGTSTLDVTYDSAISAITPPTKTGYTFLGYYYGDYKWFNANGTVALATNKYTYADDLTLTAKWQKNEYKLTINPNGGNFSGSTSSQSIPFDIQTNGVTFPEPKRTGWTFVGWEITGDLVTEGKGRTITGYTAGDPSSYTGLTGTGWWGNGTATAMWRCRLTIKCNIPERCPSSTNRSDQYIYFYNCSNSGNCFSGASPVSGSSIKTLTRLGTTMGSKWLSSVPTATAYNLKGFYTSTTAVGMPPLQNNGALTSSLTSLNGDTTWYAQWDPIKYKVTLDVNGGKLPSGKTSPVEYTIESDTFQDMAYSTTRLGYTPARTDWDFVGWKGSVPSGSSASDPWLSDNLPHRAWYASGSNYLYGNYTLTAVWQSEITLDLPHLTSPIAASTAFNFKGPLYYYTGYGFSVSESPSFSSSSSFITNLFTGGRTKPTCSDDGWEFAGFENNVGETVGKDGALNARYVQGNDLWTAQWVGKVYTITLNPNTGTQTGTTQIKYRYGEHYYIDRDTGVSIPDCTTTDANGKTVKIPVPTKEGWDFAGYYYGNYQYQYYHACTRSGHDSLHLMGATLWSDKWPGSSFKGDLTLTAMWTREITLDPYGGVTNAIAGSDKLTCTYGQALPASLLKSQIPSSPIIAPEGVEWTFRGFYPISNDPTATRYYSASGQRTYGSTPITTTGLKTLYAQWERNLTIEKNGGTGGQDNVYALKGYAMDKIEDRPEKPGYKLTGFWTEKTGGTRTHDEDGECIGAWVTTYASDTIYAQWAAEPATITFDANPPEGYEGTGGPSDIVGETDRVITDRTLPREVPIVPDYAFSYWSTDPAGNDELEQLPERFPAGTTTYYAQYNAKPDSLIKVNTQGDEYGGGRLNTYHASGLASDTLRVRPDTGRVYPGLTAVPDEGYRFTGWYEGDVLKSNEITWNPPIPEGGWPAETTYTAHFEQIEYTITYRCAACDREIPTGYSPCEHVYDINGIAGGSQALPRTFRYENIVDEEKSITLGEPMMYAIWYSFAGWSGTDVGPDKPKSFRISTLGNKVYTIHATPVSYTLTLDAAEGTWDGVETGEFVSTDDPQVIERSYTVETAAFQLPQPKREGYTFDGWASYTGITFPPQPNYYGDKTLVAQWSANPYQITYELSDELGAGSLPEEADNPLNYSPDSADISLPIPSRIGYDFVGWTEASVSDGGAAILGDAPQIDVVIPAGSWGNRVYRAHWRAHKYNVALDLAGGAWPGTPVTNPFEATYDADVAIPPVPKRPGHLFSGWQLVRQEGENQTVEQFDANQTVKRPNWVAQMGEPAYEGVPENKGGSVTLTALWTVNISVAITVGSQGVHMSLESRTDSREPFATASGEAVLKNYTDAPVKVVSIEPNHSSDFTVLKANAMQLFRDEQSLQEAAFTVRPSNGTGNTQVGRFGIADPNCVFTLNQNSYLNGNPEHTFARNWLMYEEDASDSELYLTYELDMGGLLRGDVELSKVASLQISDLVYTVALLCP